jgi:hypothetical protein
VPLKSPAFIAVHIPSSANLIFPHFPSPDFIDLIEAFSYESLWFEASDDQKCF